MADRPINPQLVANKQTDKRVHREVTLLIIKSKFYHSYLRIIINDISHQANPTLLPNIFVFYIVGGRRFVNFSTTNRAPATDQHEKRCADKLGHKGVHHSTARYLDQYHGKQDVCHD